MSCNNFPALERLGYSLDLDLTSAQLHVLQELKMLHKNEASASVTSNISSGTL